MSTSYIGFSNDTLAQRHTLAIGDTIICPTCGGEHVIKGGLQKDGVETDLLLFYGCGKKKYLAGVDGRSTMQVKADVAGEI